MLWNELLGIFSLYWVTDSSQFRKSTTGEQAARGVNSKTDISNNLGY